MRPWIRDFFALAILWVGTYCAMLAWAAFARVPL